MKKKLCMALAVAMAAGSTPAYAAEVPIKKTVKAIPIEQEMDFWYQEVVLQGYNIEGYTYFRLRDLADAVRDTFPEVAYEFGHQPFEITYDAEDRIIHLQRGQTYTGEAEQVAEQKETWAIPTDMKLTVDGVESQSKGYNIGGYTYYKLRDIFNTDLDIPVVWSSYRKTIGVGLFPAAKPVIYLYPEETTDVSVDLDVAGRLNVTYPAYNDGWNVVAQPDGTLTNKADGREYSYLFWEGNTYGAPDFSEGFCVKGEDTVAFLQEKLAEMGMTPKEYNEFIVYWLPYMQDNAYNLISFQWENYEEAAELHITPEPDNMLRVFMAFKPLEQPVEVPEQKLPTLERKGFTVVEWGGTEVR